MYCSDEQREAVESPARHKLIRGCAGSRKTDTLAKIAVRAVARGKNVLMLTLVGSVTREICDRLTRSFSVAPAVRGNHYSWRVGDAHVEVANFDAMVHFQLTQHADYQGRMRAYGDCYALKAVDLHEMYVRPGGHTKLFMVEGATADVLLMDEFQDLQISKVRLLAGLVRNSGAEAVAAGDFLQTIFEHALGEEAHPMELWRDELRCEVFDMTVCFRCPGSHVGFANAVMGAFQRRWNCPPMRQLPSREDGGELAPIVFRHEAVTKNTSGHSIAGQVTAAIAAIRANEPDLVPQDVAVIMTRSNNNAVFYQLEKMLGEMYAGWGLPDATRVFATRTASQRAPIDGSQAEGRTVMLSVHGDKGRDHRVVFFLGCSERAIPSWSRVCKESELVDASMMNVAITRSTRYLCVGFAETAPSRYLLPGLGHCTVSWSCQDAPRVARDVCGALEVALGARSGPPDMMGARRCTPTIGPRKMVAGLEEDVAEAFEHPQELDPSYPWEACSREAFGRAVSIGMPPGRRAATLSCMGRLLLRREHCVRRGRMAELRASLAPLVCERLCFTDSDELLNAAHDVRYNAALCGAGGTDMAFGCVRQALLDELAGRRADRAPGMLASLAFLRRQSKATYLVHRSFQDLGVARCVAPFTDGRVPTSELSAEDVWRVAIAFQAVFEDVRVACIWGDADAYEEGFSEMLKNVVAANALLPELQFDARESLLHTETDADVLAEMGVEGSRAVVGIAGKAEFTSEDAIVDVRCPVSGVFSSKWLLPSVVYGCICRAKAYDRIIVVDLINGEIRRYEGVGNMRRHGVVRAVLEKMGHRPEHVEALVARCHQQWA